MKGTIKTIIMIHLPTRRKKILHADIRITSERTTAIILDKTRTITIEIIKQDHNTKIEEIITTDHINQTITTMPMIEKEMNDLEEIMEALQIETLEMPEIIQKSTSKHLIGSIMIVNRQLRKQPKTDRLLEVECWAGQTTITIK